MKSITNSIIFLTIFLIINSAQADDPDGWASSLHLIFQDDSNEKADLLMTDVMIDSSAQYTYYAFINFTGGYSGFQDHGDYKTVHFSLWDYVDGDAQDVPADKAARIVWCGYRVNGSGFGNEGTGVKTSRRYDWKKNQPYRVAVKFRHGKYDTLDGAYRDYWIYNFEEQNWFHMATLWRKDNNGEKEYAGEVHTFVEDWARTGENFRSCYVYNARKKYYASTEWKIYDHAYYSINDDETQSPGPHDPNTQAEVREDNKIWLATGGDFTPENRTSSNTTLHFTPNKNINKPQTPGLTDINVSNTGDSTFQVSWDYENKKWAAQEFFEIRVYTDEGMSNSIYKTGKLYPHDHDPSPLRPKDDRFYKFSDRKYEISGLNLEKDKTYYLRLITRTIFGYNSWNTEPIAIQNYTDIEKSNNNLPNKIQLNQNYPNPFNASTKFTFEIPKQQNVTISIYNLQGKKVGTLLDDKIKSAGSHEIIFNASDYPSGLYFYKLSTGKKNIVKKMLLLK